MLRSPVRRSLVLGGAACVAAAGLPASSAARKKSRPVAADDSSPDVVTYGQRDDVMAFADGVAERQGVDPAWVRGALAQSRYMPSVARYIMPAPVGVEKNWAAYRARFVEPVRIRAGVAFWKANRRWLAMAEDLYGVPPEIVVGIIGVETIYGRQMGNFRVIDALATLSFDFPTGRSDRSAFFKSELESWFVLCRSEGVEPLDWKSSYAGAIGMAQFMPSSVNKYAVDLDADGHVDLRGSSADAIGSVANYLAEFGWQRGLPVRFEVAAPTDPALLATLLAGDITPTFSSSEMMDRGAVLSKDGQAATGRLAFVELRNGVATPSYIAGTTNFFAITRYNWSSYYAMAVFELGQAVRRVLS